MRAYFSSCTTGDNKGLAEGRQQYHVGHQLPSLLSEGHVQFLLPHESTDQNQAYTRGMVCALKGNSAITAQLNFFFFFLIMACALNFAAAFLVMMAPHVFPSLATTWRLWLVKIQASTAKLVAVTR